MVDVLVDHVGHPNGPEQFTSKTKFYEGHTIDDVRTIVKNTLPSPELENYNPFIEIFDPEASQNILLNQEYINSSRPFSKQETQLSSGSEGNYKRQWVRLRVTWSLKTKHEPISATPISSKWTRSR